MEMVGVIYDHNTGVCSTAPVSVARLSLPLWCKDRCCLGKSWKDSVASGGCSPPKQKNYQTRASTFLAYETTLETVIQEWKLTQLVEYLKKTDRLNEFWFRSLDNGTYEAWVQCLGTSCQIINYYKLADISGWNSWKTSQFYTYLIVNS